MAKPYEALKAAELLAKLAGWNEPERTEHQHVHLAVDAGLIVELRQGCAALAARSAKESGSPANCQQRRGFSSRSRVGSWGQP
jgi:hypothetical protein